MRVLRPVLTVAASMLLAGVCMAQDRYATVDIRAGYTVPFGNSTKDTFKGQSSFGEGAAIALADHIHLGATFDWAHHSVKQADGTVIGGPNDQQYNAFHTFLKVSWEALNASKLTIGVNAGPGIVFFSPNEVLKQQGATGDRHFAVNLGATITYWFSDRIGIVLSPQADIAMKKISGQVFTTGSAMLFPMTGGLRFKL